MFQTLHLTPSAPYSPLCFQLPPAPKDFTGRQDLMKQIQQAFAAKKKTSHESKFIRTRRYG